MIGGFGDIVFEVSSDTVRTFKELQKTTPARWAVHEVMGSEPIAEFIGPGQKEISLPIHLNALFLGGRTIEEEIEHIEELVDTGQVSSLVIADRVIGTYYIENIETTQSHHGKRGEVLVADVTLSLKHYVERIVQ